MENANQASEIPVSNWTLATGTRPWERHVYPVPTEHARRVRPRQNGTVADMTGVVPDCALTHAMRDHTHCRPPARAGYQPS